MKDKLSENLDQLNQLARQSMCEHTDLEYDFEWDGEPLPMLLGATCQDCGKDVDTDSWDYQLVDEIIQEEAMNTQPDYDNWAKESNA